MLVEQALQLSVEEEVHKENHASPWGNDLNAQERMFERIYGAERTHLRAAYYEETGIMLQRRFRWASGRRSSTGCSASG